MQKKFGVIPAKGIGDALIFHIASHHLTSLGLETVTFSNHLPKFGAWLKGYSFALEPPLAEIEEIFAPFSHLFLQHDNSPKAKKILTLPIPVFTFFGSHNPAKHGAYRPNLDYIADPRITMVENVSCALKKFFHSTSLENGLTPPKGLIHRRYTNRIAIHPTSSSEKKNWPKAKFLRLYKILKEKGLDPVFTVSSEERGHWPSAPLFTSLEETTSFLYESGAFIGNDSGLGHIASYLKIPHLIIGPSQKHLSLWRPGWHPGICCCPPLWIDKIKWTREMWKTFITINSVIKSLEHILL